MEVVMPSGKTLRIAFGFIGVLLAGQGIAATVAGKPGYLTYGGLVDAPLAIVIGIAIVALAVLRPSMFRK
jgi:hypothetical protein